MATGSSAPTQVHRGHSRPATPRRARWLAPLALVGLALGLTAGMASDAAADTPLPVPTPPVPVPVPLPSDGGLPVPLPPSGGLPVPLPVPLPIPPAGVPTPPVPVPIGGPGVTVAPTVDAQVCDNSVAALGAATASPCTGATSAAGDGAGGVDVSPTVGVAVCGNSVAAAGLASTTPCSSGSSNGSPADVAGAAVGRVVAATGAGAAGNALAFTGSPTVLLSSLGAGLAAVGLVLRKVAAFR